MINTLINLFFIISILYNPIRPWIGMFNVFMNILHISYIFTVIIIGINKIINNCMNFSTDFDNFNNIINNVSDNYEYYNLLLMNE